MYSRKVIGFYAHWNTNAGGNLNFSEYSRLNKYSFLYNTELGRFTYIAGAKVKNTTIGAFCSIGPESIIGGLGKHPTHFISTHPSFYSNLSQAGLSFTEQKKYTEFSQTTIGNDVWVGARVLILDGVKIGNGAIIAAGAIVTKDVKPYAIMGGIPARLIGFRFDSNVIEQLNKWEWWNLPTKTLLKLAPHFTSRENWSADNVKKLIEISEQF
jgi:acetyltransferase-like isoleucine patch superfamily enzyme